MIKRSIICLLLTINFTLAGTTAETKKLSLEDAIALALRYNPNIRIARMQRVLDKFSLKVAKNAFELQYALTMNGSIGVSRTPGARALSRSYGLSPSMSILSPYGTNISVAMSNPFSSGTSQDLLYRPSATLTIKQPLLRGAGRDVVQASLRNADIDLRVNSHLALLSSIISQVNNIVNEYYNLVQAKNKVIIQKRAYDQQEGRYKTTKARIKAGKVAPREIINEERTLRQHKFSLTQAKNNVITSRQEFIQALGLFSRSDLDVESELHIKETKIPTVKEAQDIALKKNLSYQQAKNSFAKTERALLVAKNQAEWDLSLTGTYTRGGGKGGLGAISHGHEQARSLGISLDIPIRNLSFQQSILAAKNSLEQAKITLEVQKQKLLLQVSNKIQSLHNLKQQMLQLAELVKTSQDALMIEEKKQEVGMSTILDVAIRQNDLIQAENDQAESRISFFKSMNELWGLLGTTLDEWKISIQD